MTNNSNHIAGKPFVHRFTVTPKQALRVVELNLATALHVKDGHFTLESTAHHAHKCNAIAVARVHIRLNLEHKAAERWIFRHHHAVAGAPRTGALRMR